jgi:hypothetical protein
MAGLVPAIPLRRAQRLAKRDHRDSRHGASKTRVNALSARPGDDGEEKIARVIESNRP